MDESRLTDLDPQSLEPSGDYAGVALRDARLARSLDGLVFDDALWSKVQAQGIALPEMRLSDSALRECDLANAVWEKLYARAVLFSGCRLTGWTASAATLRQVQFLGCKANLSGFQGVTLKQCIFDQCDLREADFQGARLARVTFRRCDLRNARFPAAVLEEVDFRASHLAGILLDPGAVRGNRFDPSQLWELARILGAQIDEPDSDPPLSNRERNRG